MLKLEHVTKYYGDFKAVDDLSFTVDDGEIFGLLGVNGAGKTTTFRMILNLLEATDGTITLNDEPINYSMSDEIGYLPEERSLLTKLTVYDQAIYFGALKGMTNKEIIARLDELLNKFEVTDYKYKKIKELSKGNQQKIQFIMAILNKPKLLILDEPFSGLDPLNIELFKKEIRELSSQGSMIIFSSHRMDHVELFCKKLVILKQGRAVISGELAKIKADYRKKNIRIRGNVDTKELAKIKYVEEVLSIGDEIMVKITSNKGIEPVFTYISKQSNITKFVVEEPTLDEIFMSVVGES